MISRDLSPGQVALSVFGQSVEPPTRGSGPVGVDLGAVLAECEQAGLAMPKADAVARVGCLLSTFVNRPRWFVLLNAPSQQQHCNQPSHAYILSTLRPSFNCRISLQGGA